MYLQMRHVLLSRAKGLQDPTHLGCEGYAVIERRSATGRFGKRVVTIRQTAMRLCHCESPTKTEACRDAAKTGLPKCDSRYGTNSRCPLADSCDDDWSWSPYEYDYARTDLKVYGPRSRTVLLHPGWSNGTVAVRGNKPLLAPIQHHLASSAYYWEIDVSHRVFGTSIMFGVGTKMATLCASGFTDLLGRDAHSWALSHKGLIWHNGLCSDFTEPFAENTPTTIGLMLDWSEGDGTLSYYKDGRYLGTAFRNLAETLRQMQSEDGEQLCLYPMVSSTAARTEMCLVSARRRLTTLQDRCTWQIARRLRKRAGDVDALQLPDSLRMDLKKRVLAMF